MQVKNKMHISQFNKQYLTVGKLLKSLKDYPNNTPVFVEDVSIGQQYRRKQILGITIKKEEYINRRGEKNTAIVLWLEKGV